MSTRSNIGIQNEDGSLDVIYCHWDGYPSHNGAILLHHYQDLEKIRELIALGDISSLAAAVKAASGEHTFESPQEGVVVAYGRDRHEDGIGSRHFDTLDDYQKLMRSEGGYIEYVYLYKVADRKWLWSPALDDLGIKASFRQIILSFLLYPQLRIGKSHRENKLPYGLSTELYPAACSKAPDISSCCAAGIPILVAIPRQPDTARAIGTSNSLASLGRK